MRAGGIVVTAAYVLSWWVLASFLSRRHGALAFAAGLGALAVAAWLRGRGRPQWLMRAVFLSMLAATAVLLVEGALRLRPRLLGGRVANFAYSGYHAYRGGIYTPDAELGQAMRADVRRWMYWNGHWWRHVSNARGWRGPESVPAAVLFLGDSMVYGHGLQEGETLPVRFAARTSLSAANLGQQGTGAVQQLGLLRRRGGELRPRVVFLCAHPNDLEDVPALYETAEQRQFLERPDRTPLVRPEFRPRPRWDPLWLWARHAALPLWSGGMLGSLQRVARERRTQEFGAPRDPFVPTPPELEQDVPALRPSAPEADARAWQVHRAAVAEIRRQCGRLGARLVLFDLGYPRAFTQATEALAREVDASYSPAGRAALQRALSGEAIYLANDGHWSARGADAVAEELARAAATQAIIGSR